MDQINPTIAVFNERYVLKSFYLSNNQRRIRVVIWGDLIGQHNHLVQLRVVLHINSVLVKEDRVTNDVNVINVTLHIQHHSIVQALGYFPLLNIEPIIAVVPENRMVVANFDNIASLHQGCSIGMLVFHNKII